MKEYFLFCTILIVNTLRLAHGIVRLERISSHIYLCHSWCTSLQIISYIIRHVSLFCTGVHFLGRRGETHYDYQQDIEVILMNLNALQFYIFKHCNLHLHTHKLIFFCYDLTFIKCSILCSLYTLSRLGVISILIYDQVKVIYSSLLVHYIIQIFLKY